VSESDIEALVVEAAARYVLNIKLFVEEYLTPLSGEHEYIHLRSPTPLYFAVMRVVLDQNMGIYASY